MNFSTTLAFSLQPSAFFSAPDTEFLKRHAEKCLGKN